MTPSAPSSPPATCFTARTPEDLLAVAPVVLGFQPADSIVLLTFGAARPFHARIDLPTSAAQDAETVRSLLDPARLHQVRAAALLVYADAARAHVAGRVGRSLVRAFEQAGIDVVGALRADGSRWHPLLASRRDGVPAQGVPYDLSCHPFTAQAVLDGRPLRGSRAELEQSLQPDPDGAAAVAARFAAGDLAGPVPTAAGVTELVAAHLGAGRLPDAVLVRVLVAILDPAVRDGAWVGVRRRDAMDHVRVWTDAVRRAPDELRGGAAAVLALLAWRAGDGALAWCAVDRCWAVDPANTLARLVADALERAIPPDTLDELEQRPGR